MGGLETPAPAWRKRPGAEPLPRLSPDEARDLAIRAFRRAGVPEEAAEQTAEILTLAETMGIGTHGLARVVDYCDRIAAGGIDSRAQIVETAPAPALRHIDGRNGLGPWVARRALDAGMDAARRTGIGAAFVTSGSHVGALAPYLWIAAEAGFAALVTTNTAPMLAPAGGKAPLIGNNPIGIGLPGPEGAHVLLDMALSVVARSRVRAAATASTPIPENWATDVEGRPTTDPRAAMRGLMQAIGGAKGANFALCLDLMAAGLAGSAMLTEIPAAADQPGTPQNLGIMLVLIDAGALQPDGGLPRRVGTAAAIIGGSAALDEGAPPRLPGARAIAALRRARAGGLVLSSALLEALRARAGET